MPTRADYRRALGRELGGYGVFTSTSAGTTTQIFSALNSDQLPDSHLANAWLYVPSFGVPNQRRIKRDGLAASGMITVESALSAAVASGAMFEIGSKLPPTGAWAEGWAGGREIGLNECVNLALRHLLVPDVLTTQIVNGQTSYPLTTWESWLDRPGRLVDVREPSVFSGWPARPLWRGWLPRADAGRLSIELDTPYPATIGSLTLDVLRPAHTLINDVEATLGLQAEADTAKALVDDVVTVGLVYAYRALAASRNGAEYERKALQQEERARALLAFDRTTEFTPEPRAEAA